MVENAAGEAETVLVQLVGAGFVVLLKMGLDWKKIAKWTDLFRDNILHFIRSFLIGQVDQVLPVVQVEVPEEDGPIHCQQSFEEAGWLKHY